MVYWIPDQLDLVFQLVIIILYMTIAFLALTGFMAIIVAVILILPDSKKAGSTNDSLYQNIQKGGACNDNHRNGIPETPGEQEA